MNTIITIAIMTQSLLLFDFTENSGKSNPGYIVDDGVMGGRSQGNLSVEDGYARYWGKVSLENNGGFSSVRFPVNNIEVKNFEKFVIRVKGDGNNYQFRVRSNRSERHSYQSIFSTTGDWQTVEIPFDAMIPTFRGVRLNMNNYPGEVLSEVAFLISNKKEEEFDLRIELIGLE